MNTAKLITYIEQHGHRAELGADGSLACTGWVRLASGEMVELTESVPATLRDVRAWLGY